MRKATRIGLIAALLLNTATVFAQSGVPPENQARILDAKIAFALKNKNNQALIDYIEQYRKLGSVFPNDLLVTEAEAADNSGDPARALSVLNDYLKVAKKTDNFYDEAISIYPTIEVKADKAIVSAFVASLPGQMKKIPAGTFIMGTDMCPTPKGHYDDHENRDPLTEYHVCHSYLYDMGDHLTPAHQVSIAAFWMQQTYVDPEVVRAFARVSGHPEPGPPTLALVSDFLTLLKQTTHRDFRLPSEAEWEYAMVSGNPPQYPWEVCSNGKACKSTLLFQPDPPDRENRFGITGFYGELVADCWHENYNGAPTNGSAWDTQCAASQLVVRGGKMYNAYLRWPDASHVAWPKGSYQYLTFRVAVSIPRQ